MLLSSFDRPNIFYSVHYLLDAADPLDELVTVVTSLGEVAAPCPCIIIYALKRETVDEAAGRLCRHGESCIVAAGGMPSWCPLRAQQRSI